MWIVILAAAAVMGVGALFAGISRLRLDSSALEHTARETISRIQELESRMERMERAMAEGMCMFRDELRSSQKEAREEQRTLDAEARSEMRANIAAMCKMMEDRITAAKDGR